MELSIKDWHQRFRQQARWTEQIREYLFDRAGLSVSQKVLEVGCGTGAVLSELDPSAVIHGLDIDHRRILFARKAVPQAHLVTGDAVHLPYPENSFEIVFCHFLLLWLPDPAAALEEFARVIRPGGYIIAAAEPDYGGRIDQPEELAEIGKRQTQSLIEQGADPFAGGKLARWFHEMNLVNIESGKLDDAGNQKPSKEFWELEWRVLSADVRKDYTQSEIAILKEIDWAAWQAGNRILYIPTHYAIGQVGD